MQDTPDPTECTGFQFAPFILAFIAAPFLVTALTFWVYLIPFYALMLGGPVYAVVGGPVLVWYLRRYPPDIIPIILLAMIAQLVLIPLMLVAALYSGDWNMLEALPALLSMAALFGLLWSGTFILMYRLLIRAPKS